ncbi:MAG: dephospho-CoA kinase [Actinomycetota bacterium]|nr:dephospho-CoA kinase [Actinomycetota bacterium]
MRVGLTGGIGSGKSEVSRRLAERGAVLIDADVLAREVVEPGTDGFAEVVAAFGPDVVGPDGRLDRARLARLVFADPDNRGRLNGIVHPRVRAETERRMAAARPDAIVVNDVPLLVENGRAGAYDMVVVVQAPVEQRLRRLTSVRGMTAAEAQARIAAQASDSERRTVADVIVHNDADLTSLDRQVGSLWRLLQARARATVAGSGHDAPPPDVEGSETVVPRP